MYDSQNKIWEKLMEQRLKKETFGAGKSVWFYVRAKLIVNYFPIEITNGEVPEEERFLLVFFDLEKA